MTSAPITSNHAVSAEELSLASITSQSLPPIEVTMCSTCHYPSWTEERLIDEKPEISCDSFDDLRTSAASGCPGCEVMKQAWVWGTPDENDRSNESIHFNRSSGSLGIRIHTKGRALKVDVFTLEHSLRFKHIRVASLIPRSTNIDINCNRIHQWITKCEQQHTSCQVNGTSSPHRLLDLKSAVNGIVRIVETGKNLPGEQPSPPVDFQYACLSHCWGKSRSKHLTRRSNFDKNISGIPIAELPQTFRDAVEISQALNIRYLWIDSLCIIQDDDADWEAHVKLMANIYRNAYITLAAGASEDDDGGFFRQSKEEYTKLHSFTVTDGDIDYTIYLRLSLPHPDEQWSDVAKMPLLSRGWVFQERLLSKRFVCFNRNEILWECQEDVACSCSTSDMAFNHRVRGAKPGFLNCGSTKFDISTISRLPQTELWLLWRDMVNQYTQRQLTYPSDKLAALAGLAVHFENAGTGTYLHGLWLEALETDLLWESNDFSTQETRPRKAPSWSWISATDGVISWPVSTLHNSGWHVISVPVHDFTSRGNNQNPRLLPLEVKGNLGQLSLELSHVGSMQKAFPGFRSVNLKLASSNNLVINSIIGQTRVAAGLQSSELDGTTTARNYRGEVWTDYKFWTDEVSLWNILANIYFLEMGIEENRKIYDFEFYPNCWVTGLLLRPTNPEENSIIPSLERIGRLRFTTEAPKDQWKPLGIDTTFSIV